ncbi:outer membrane lipoprotein-sorting protein [Rhodovibrionaceae bacterium A322]
MFKKTAALGLVLAAALLGRPSQAADLSDAQAIIHNANYMAYYQGQDGRAQVTMTIFDSQGRERERKLTILRKDQTDSEERAGQAYRSDQLFYIYFHRPADVSKMVFMVHKSLEQEDDRWLYLPALDLVKRIAATDKRTSFAGSDFFYEDVSGRLLEADSHELIGTSESYYQLRSTPKDPGSVEFAYYETFVHKNTFLPVQTRYYDAQHQPLRTIATIEVADVEGYPTVVRAEASNHQTGSRTVMSYDEVTYNLGLPEDVFTERYLRRAPRKHLR